MLLSSKIKVDLSGIKKDVQGNYDEKELNTVLQKALKAYQDEGYATSWKNAHELIAYEIARFYQRYVDDIVGPVNGKKCMINCRSQAEAQLQARILNKVFGKMVAGTWTSDSKDKTVLNKFVKGDMPILCQVGKLSEGFDMPELDMCINYPTCSRVVEAQRGGRVLRLNPANQSKFALVVDIVFSHPDYDNPILSSHANGQILYRDITNNFIIKNETQNKENLNLNSSNHISSAPCKVELDTFEIISSVEELITLQNSQAQIPFLNKEGFLNSQDLYKYFYTNLKDIRPLLKKGFYDNLTFDMDGEQTPLIQKWKQLYFLTNHPKAFASFEEYAKINLICLTKREKINYKREGMLTSRDLYQQFLTSPNDLRFLLKKALEDDITFTQKGIDYPLVEEITTGNRVTPALHENPLALEVFKKFAISHQIQLKERDDSSIEFISLKKLNEEYVFIVSEIRNFLKTLLQENTTFKIGKKTYPLVIQNQLGYIGIYHNQKAIECLSKLAEQRNIRFSSRTFEKRKRKNLLTRDELNGKWPITKIDIKKLLKKCFDEEITFLIDGETYPLVEKITKGQSLALNNHPNALKVFEEKAIQENFLINTRQEGTLASTELCKILHTTPKNILIYLRKYYTQNKTFESEGKIYPLVEIAKNNTVKFFVLSAKKEALPALKAFLQEENIPFGYSQKRKGMLSIYDFYDLIGKTSDITRTLYQKLFQEKRTFELDGKNIPLLEKVVSSSGKIIIALHEHPKALETFIQEAEKEGINLRAGAKKVSSSKKIKKQDTQHQNNG